MSVYYNEIDPYAAAWLRNLIAAGHIAPGVVDERSIEDVRPADLADFTQCHFFAGIGVWSLALRRAGWGDDRPVWTGSCPCQPFSAAGQGSGFSDERHLWPAFHWLIQECRPPVILGEQVASSDAGSWLDLVQIDLEAMGHAFGAVAFPSAGVGAPHIRDRLYWVADADRSVGGKGRSHVRGRPDRGHAKPRPGSGGRGLPHRLANNYGDGCGALPIPTIRNAQHHAEPRGEFGGVGYADSKRTGRDGGSVCGAFDRQDGQHSADHVDTSGRVGLLGDAERAGLALGQRIDRIPCGASGADAGQAVERAGIHAAARPGPTNGLWAATDWLSCRDGKWRPVSPGTFPLVAGSAAGVGRVRADWHAAAGKEGQGHRAGRLKGYGNAINAEAARVFIEAVMEAA